MLQSFIISIVKKPQSLHLQAAPKIITIVLLMRLTRLQRKIQQKGNKLIIIFRATPKKGNSLEESNLAVFLKFH